jgi:integrase/recombinase XerD
MAALAAVRVLGSPRAPYWPPIQVYILAHLHQGRQPTQEIRRGAPEILAALAQLDPHQRNFETTARRFLAELPEGGLRAVTVQDVRDALTSMSAGLSEASARQYVLRIKSLLGYAHALGYTPFNAGATIKVRSDAGSRGANLAKRIMSEVEVGLLIRAAPTKRDRVLLEVIYAGGLRVSETVALTWADVLPRDDRVQLSIMGKGGKVRQVHLPDII